MKKIFLIFTVLLLTALILISPVFAYEIDYNNGAITYNYAPLTRFTEDKSGYTVVALSANDNEVTIDMQFNKLNHVIDHTAVSRITMSGKSKVFPIPFTSYMTGYQLSINGTNINTSFYETYTMTYDTTSFVFDRVTPNDMNISGHTITMRIYTAESIPQNDVRDNAEHILSAIWVYFGQNGDKQAYDLNNGDYNRGFQAGQEYGYQRGLEDYLGYAQQEYTKGYYQGRSDFGYRNGVIGGADYWFEQGQLSETDWFVQLTSAFFGVFQVLSVEILPGIQLGYFVGFFLVLGVAGMIIGSFMIRRK